MVLSNTRVRYLKNDVIEIMALEANEVEGLFSDFGESTGVEIDAAFVKYIYKITKGHTACIILIKSLLSKLAGLHKEGLVDINLSRSTIVEQILLHAIEQCEKVSPSFSELDEASKCLLLRFLKEHYPLLDTSDQVLLKQLEGLREKEILTYDSTRELYCLQNSTRFYILERLQPKFDNIEEFVLATLSAIRPSVLQNSFDYYGADKKRLERAWQMEFYRAAAQILPPNMYITPDVEPKFGIEGYIDFCVHARRDGTAKWLIELTSDGIKVTEYHAKGEQSPAGTDAGVITQPGPQPEQYLVLDFAHTKVYYTSNATKSRNIWYIRYVEDYVEADITRVSDDARVREQVKQVKISGDSHRHGHTIESLQQRLIQACEEDRIRQLLKLSSAS